MNDGLIGGRYRLGDLLGSGGTAAVYAGTGRDGVPVAIKLLHPHLSESPAMWDAFFEEVRAAQAIRHPGIARVLDYGVQEGQSPTVWIAMELVTGRTLAQVVADRGALAPADTAQVAEGLLSALAATHRGGVVHRDVSPANVMLDPTSLGTEHPVLAASVRLLDFGLADIPGRPTAGTDALLSGSGAEEGVVASVPYASPEHLRAAPVTESSDVYQVACTVFFALTGRAPFVGTRPEVMRAHLTSPAPLASRHRPGLSPAVDRWLLVALGKSPALRYRDAAAMLAAMPAGFAKGTAVAVLPAVRRPAEATERTRLLPVAAPVVAPEGIPRGGRPRPRTAGWLVAGAGGLAIAGIVAIAAVGATAPTAVATTAPSAPTAAPAPTASSTPTAAATVSAEVRAVPEIIGLSLADAIARLQAEGFAVGAVTAVDIARAAETVLEADPGPQARMPRGSTVSLRVASGNNRVPEVGGMSVADATAMLAAEGFAVSTRTVPGGVAGQVAATDPASGVIVPLGGSVVLLVQTVRPSASTTPTAATPVPTATPSPTATAGSR